MTTPIFRQLFDPASHTYTYIIADATTREAAIIDPVREHVARDHKILSELDLRLKFILETHIHADHITGSYYLKKFTGAFTVVGAASGGAEFDLKVKDNDALPLGTSLFIRPIATPGHTNGCTSYIAHDRVFTGDTLLIRGCGRTDFQEGSADQLYDSVRNKLFALSDATLVYPGHDYKGFTASTIGEEKKFNPRLNLSINKMQFFEIMKNLQLSPPPRLEECVAANLKAGRMEESSSGPNTV